MTCRIAVGTAQGMAAQRKLRAAWQTPADRYQLAIRFRWSSIGVANLLVRKESRGWILERGVESALSALAPAIGAAT